MEGLVGSVIAAQAKIRHCLEVGNRIPVPRQLWLNDKSGSASLDNTQA
jgi:hypothetical protein